MIKNSSLHLIGIELFSQQFGRVLLAFFSCLSPIVAAQTEPRPPTVQVAAVSLLDTPPPALYFRDLDDQLKPFVVSRGSRSVYNTVPVAKTLQLYRMQTDEAGQEAPVPAMALELERTETPILFLLHRGHTGKTAIHRLPADAASHPSGTVVLMNLCGKPIGVLLGQERIMLSENETRTVDMPDATTLSFTWAFEREGMKPYRSATQRLRFFQPSQRLLIPFAGNLQTVETATGPRRVIFPNAFRLYDTPPVLPDS